MRLVDRKCLLLGFLGGIFLTAVAVNAEETLKPKFKNAVWEGDKK